MITFKEWIKKKEESSAFTRTRRAAALGTGPMIPLASLHSRSTAAPWEVEKITKRSKLNNVKRKKRKKKNH